MEDVIVERPQRIEWDCECYTPGPRLMDDIQRGDLCKYVSPYKDDRLDGEMMMIIDVCTAADIYEFQPHRNVIREEIQLPCQLGGATLRRESFMAHCITSVGVKWIPCKRLKIV